MVHASTSPPGIVTILANPECPHCVHATDKLTEWCCEIGAPVAGVDVLHHPEVAKRWNLEESPSILLERPGGPPKIFAGFPTHAEFLRFMRDI